MKQKFSIDKSAGLLKLSVVATAVLIGSAAHGQATVDPATQPFMTLAPYVLKSSNLEPRVGNEDGGTRAYRPWFENGAWTGDLIEYEVTEDGLRVPRTDTGRYPRDGRADWRGTGTPWSARYSFPDYQWYDASQPLPEGWDCPEELNYEGFWQSRNIITTQSGGPIPFLWSELNDAQRASLDPGVPTEEIEDFSSPILNYVRGDRSNERCKGGAFRWRYSVLGAIVNSRPVFVPAGTDGLVVVGANDGMLHGFSAANGTEQFAYVPSMLLPKLVVLSRSPYRPTYFVDGELRHSDVGTSEDPRHIVAGGLGAGGKGLFVLDVSSPGSPDVVVELSGTAGAYIGGTYNSHIGYIHGRPTIARLPDGNGGVGWFAVSGNGYDSDSGTTGLVLIPLSGSPAPQFVDTLSDTNGLSAPALVDATGNGVVDYAYAGDLEGNLWRFNLNNRTTSLLFAAGSDKPITVEPDVAKHPDTQVGYMIYFGTGSLLSAADAEVVSDQTIYGIWDRGDEVTEDRLVLQTLVSHTETWPIPEENNLCDPPPGEGQTAQSTIRVIRDRQPMNWGGGTPNLGWRVDLPRDGERLIGRPQVRAERVQFITTNPYDMLDPARMGDPESGSWILQLDLASGANANRPRALYDLNKDCTLNVGDGLPLALEGGTIPAGTFPVGVNIGPFNVAQPAFARVRFDPLVRSVVDGVYINALQLPPPVTHGDRTMLRQIDVTTDSHFGPAHRLGPEPEKEGFSGTVPQFADSSGPTKPYIRWDGLGHRVDGHAFGYNYHHDIDYVDFFALEPQRDALAGEPREPPGWRLDVGAVYREGGTGPFIPLNLPPRRTHQELNRVTEVEISPDQKFIVMVTNADLSQSVKIQIGCEFWDVYDYQTMMMGHLRSGSIPANRIYTLSGSHNPIRPASGSLSCTNFDWDGRPLGRTLRLTPGQYETLDDLLGTRPGCVNNTDIYERSGSQTNRRQTRKSTQLNPDGSFANLTPTELYTYTQKVGNTDVQYAHVTPNQEGSGYRWRNGALTVQLIAVNDDLSFDFSNIQDVGLPEGVTLIREGDELGWGGAYARAFRLNAGMVEPITDGASPPTSSLPVSGMLYELSMFWHWGDMARYQQEGTPSAHCYGARQLNASLNFETEQYNAGAYQQLTKDFDEDLQREYLRLLESLQDPELAEAALIRLAEIFAMNEGQIGIYHRLRPYVPTAKQLEGHPNLILIDRGGIESSFLAEDGTPVPVLDVERDLLPSLGPNYQPGRRSWIDLAPE